MSDPLASAEPTLAVRPEYADPSYLELAKAFERRLGAYALNHPRSLAAARVAARRALQVLQAAHPGLSHDQVAEVFFKDDSTSAGQVGLGQSAEPACARLMNLVDHGNVRELMTALLNAIDFNDSPLTLKSLCNKILEERAWDRAGKLGLDVEFLQVQAECFHSVERAETYRRLSSTDPRAARSFAKDVFGHAVMLVRSSRASAFLQELLASRSSRQAVAPADWLAGGYARTKREYEEDGAPLSKREIAMLVAKPVPIEVQGYRLEPLPLDQLAFDEDGDPVLKEPDDEPGLLGIDLTHDYSAPGWPVIRAMKVIAEKHFLMNPMLGVVDLKVGASGPQPPLNWMSGGGRHQLDTDSPWYRGVALRRGMPVATGMSGSTLVMLTAMKILGTGPLEDIFLALVGWMLHPGDHSLYEIAAAAAMTGHLPPLPEGALDHAAQLYGTIPGLPLSEIRAKVAEHALLPHEAVRAAAVGNGGESVGDEPVE